jgi:hypothetical protein
MPSRVLIGGREAAANWIDGDAIIDASNGTAVLRV